MKVSRRSEKTVKFGSLNIGTVFEDGDGDIAMKVRYESKFMAVLLETGAVYQVADSDLVRPINGEFNEIY